MKVGLLSLLVLSCFVLGSVAQNPFQFSSIFSNFIERIRGRFKCGFPEINLAPLDPLILPNYSVFLKDIIIAQDVNVSLANVEVVGLSGFELTNPYASIGSGLLSFTVLHPELKIKGRHTTNGTASGLPFIGFGDFNITVKNVLVKSEDRFSFWPRLQIISHDADITIESASANFTGFGSDSTDSQVSELLSKGGPNWVNNNREFINAEVSKVVVKYVNNVLRRRRNLVTIIFGMLTYNRSSPCRTVSQNTVF